jgi:hypothetical protein
VGEITLKAIELIHEFLPDLVQLSAPGHWTQMQFQRALVPDKDVLNSRHGLQLTDLGCGQLALVKKDLTTPTLAFKLKKPRARQAAHRPDQRKRRLGRDGHGEARFFSRLLRGCRTSLYQQLASGQDIADKGRQREQVHIATLLERFAQFLGAKDKHGQGPKRFLGANLANEGVSLLVLRA